MTSLNGLSGGSAHRLGQGLADPLRPAVSEPAAGLQRRLVAPGELDRREPALHRPLIRLSGIQWGPRADPGVLSGSGSPRSGRARRVSQCQANTPSSPELATFPPDAHSKPWPVPR